MEQMRYIDMHNSNLARLRDGRIALRKGCSASASR
jgi:hypothetical protein